MMESMMSEGARMRRMFVFSVMFAVLVAGSHWAVAAETQSHESQAMAPAKAQQPVEAPAAAPQPVTPPAAAKPLTPEQHIQAQLNGTTWSLDLAASGQGKKSPKDTVTFEDGKVSSARLSKAGYGQSNYTLTIGDDGVAVWETMQSQDGKGVVFWRGELHGSAMRGIVSEHPTEGENNDWSFSGAENSGRTIQVPAHRASVAPAMPSAPPVVAAPQAPAKPAPVVMTPVAPAPPAAAPRAPVEAPAAAKKKKGWF